MADKLMRIGGMTCDHCEKTVAEALTGAGARDVTADWRAGQARFDAASGDEQLAAAVERHHPFTGLRTSADGFGWPKAPSTSSRRRSTPSSLD